MRVRSMGYRTDLIFVRFDGEVLVREDHIVARTETNPSYHWGNFLLFDQPPKEGDMERWCALFEQEIAAKQPTEHIAFAWDTVEGERGECQPFLDRGFVVEDSLVMTAPTLSFPAQTNHEVEVRALRTDEEWEAATTLQIENREARFSRESYTVFKVAQMKRYREMSRQGMGHWYGAFIGAELVADMGLFHDGNGVARYQSVETDAAHRRQGICARLLVESSRLLAQEEGVERLENHVIVADPEGPATGVYGSVGFETTEIQMGLSWWDGVNATA